MNVEEEPRNLPNLKVKADSGKKHRFSKVDSEKEHRFPKIDSGIDHRLLHTIPDINRPQSEINVEEDPQNFPNLYRRVDFGNHRLSKEPRNLPNLRGLVDSRKRHRFVKIDAKEFHKSEMDVEEDPCNFPNLFEKQKVHFILFACRVESKRKLAEPFVLVVMIKRRLNSRRSFLVSPGIKGEKHEEKPEDGTSNLFSDLDIDFPEGMPEDFDGFDIRKVRVRRLKLLGRDLEELEDLDLKFFLRIDRRGFCFIGLEDEESLEIDMMLKLKHRLDKMDKEDQSTLPHQDPMKIEMKDKELVSLKLKEEKKQKDYARHLFPQINIIT
ncbi:hypothetical protein O9G_006003 [Rozella allomycis CSF55]|uniref:Uncharacterized protein n=1 Tax=Rozella allomycis (strain CSF55) TaxID=988480 RepID=A0A075AWF7_ROZAC|nr:hypothetical protein O9G_006003 [Rozella allomycis CSF55]|eukprot:EPZ33042.1 hypothetical protein O9G_006003 [Rozella allomycis CSF55]